MRPLETYRSGFHNPGLHGNLHLLQRTFMIPGIACRENYGLERMDQIKFAILETHGGISIIPSDAKA